MPAASRDQVLIVFASLKQDCRRGRLVGLIERVAYFWDGISTNSGSLTRGRLYASLNPVMLADRRRRRLT
jgi:hypothetical protein